MDFVLQLVAILPNKQDTDHAMLSSHGRLQQDASLLLCESVYFLFFFIG